MVSSSYPRTLWIWLGEALDDGRRTAVLEISVGIRSCVRLHAGENGEETWHTNGNDCIHINHRLSSKINEIRLTAMTRSFSAGHGKEEGLSTRRA